MELRCYLKGITSSLPNEGGDHTKVGRPGIVTGAPEGALRMATIKTPPKHWTVKGDAMRRCYGSTKPDHCFSVTGKR